MRPLVNRWSLLLMPLTVWLQAAATQTRVTVSPAMQPNVFFMPDAWMEVDRLRWLPRYYTDSDWQLTETDNSQHCHIMPSCDIQTLWKLGMCGQPKFGLDSVFKNRTVRNFYIHSDGFQYKLHAIHSHKKWINVTSLVLNKQIKNVLKHDCNRV